MLKTTLGGGLITFNVITYNMQIPSQMTYFLIWKRRRSLDFGTTDCTELVCLHLDIATRLPDRQAIFIGDKQPCLTLALLDLLMETMCLSENEVSLAGIDTVSQKTQIQGLFGFLASLNIIWLQTDYFYHWDAELNTSSVSSKSFPGSSSCHHMSTDVRSMPFYLVKCVPSPPASTSIRACQQPQTPCGHREDQ